MTSAELDALVGTSEAVRASRASALSAELDSPEGARLLEELS